MAWRQKQLLDHMDFQFEESGDRDLVQRRWLGLKFDGFPTQFNKRVKFIIHT
jgi:hypothetical protein